MFEGRVDDERRAQAHRLAAEVRRIIERLTFLDAPADELGRAADAARGFVDMLDAMLPKGRTDEGFAETAIAGSPYAFFDRSPIIGLANPLAAPIRIGMVEEGEERYVAGTAVFGTAYEGPPGHVHGGFVAAAFDEVLGMAQSLSGQVGMTGTLTIRYRKPTPLRTELSFKAWVDGVEGRKIFVSGTLHAGGTLCAEADGIFIALDPERFAKAVGRSPIP